MLYILFLRSLAEKVGRKKREILNIWGFLFFIFLNRTKSNRCGWNFALVFVEMGSIIIWLLLEKFKHLLKFLSSFPANYVHSKIGIF